VREPADTQHLSTLTQIGQTQDEKPCHCNTTSSEEHHGAARHRYLLLTCIFDRACTSGVCAKC
jgi:hypothetical protein